jgi:hypothetical protein
MAISGIFKNKTDIDNEIERRKIARDIFQAKIDVDELDRRVSDYKAGNSKLISSEEMWNNIEKMDCYR